MTGWTYALTLALVSFVGAFAAGFVPRVLPTAKKELWPATMAVAAGLLLASALVIVIPEGFEVLFLSHNPGAIPHSDTFLGLPPVLASGLAILGGFLLMLGLEARGYGHDFEDAQQPTLKILSVGLVLHALTDGLALGASVTTGMITISLPILAAVMVHKVPVAFGLGTFLWHKSARQEGDPMRILLIFSLATPLGLLLTFLFLRRLSHEWIGLMLLFSGGTFLYVATIEVLARIRQQQPGMVLFRRVGTGVVLVVVSLIVFQLIGFEHEIH